MHAHRDTLGKSYNFPDLHTRTHIHTLTHKYAYTFTHTHISTYTHIHMHMHIYTPTHTYLHTCTQTDTLGKSHNTLFPVTVSSLHVQLFCLTNCISDVETLSLLTNDIKINALHFLTHRE